MIVFLIVFGLIATQTSRVDWEALKNGMHIDDDNDWNWFEGHAYTYDDHLEQDFPAGAMLRVTDTRGAVNVTTSDTAKIQVVVRKTIRAESQGEADRWNGNTKPDIKVSGNTVTVNANNQGGWRSLRHHRLGYFHSPQGSSQYHQSFRRYKRARP